MSPGHPLFSGSSHKFLNIRVFPSVFVDLVVVIFASLIYIHNIFDLTQQQEREQMLKPSHFQTPRTLADCTFPVGYADKEPAYESILGYCLAVAIGVGLACLLVAWWSS
jgi:hypothetical protein